jgi:hypothetical protein
MADRLRVGKDCAQVFTYIRDASTTVFFLKISYLSC